MNRAALSLALAVALLGCASDKKDPSAPKTSLGTAPAGDLTVELLTDTQLETGMTPIYVKVKTATGQVVTDATVTFTPVMSMTGGMTHSAPVIGAPTIGADGMYHCDVVFQMASSAMGSWSATVGVTPAGSTAVEASFPSLSVADSGRAKTFSYWDPDTSVTTKYVASLNFEAAPRVGLNPVIVTLHSMETMMTFLPVDDATITLDPQMPSMGHGSPGSVNPTLTSSGVYAGQLSFSMAGDWETTVTVSRAGVSVGAPKFATTF
jgi:hypothetical protein